MSVVIFIIVLAILVLVHEFGHFIVAKRCGIKVTEFGIGFPPRLWGKQIGETMYSVNAIPFGGFVKIFGEDPDDESIAGPERERSIVAKHRLVQAAVLFAGVFFNVIFAWLLITGGYLMGFPTPQDYSGPGIVENAGLVVTSVSPDSPADKAGIKAGDVILSAVADNKYALEDISAKGVSDFVAARGSDGITFGLRRGSEALTRSVTAEQGIVTGKVAIGISMESIGTLKLPLHLAFVEAAKDTYNLLKETTTGLMSFLGTALVGHADLSQVTGPVGIIGLVGDVTKLGFVYLVSFTALISINLAVINLLPFPALDGGRLVMVGIEAIRRKPMPPRFVNTLNTVGFALLILLMVVVTAHDLLRFF